METAPLSGGEYQSSLTILPFFFLNLQTIQNYLRYLACEKIFRRFVKNGYELMEFLLTDKMQSVKCTRGFIIKSYTICKR